MRLLVSVRSAAEAREAAAGGADLVDAKEPARGALGPVAAAVLRDIAAAVPPDTPLSAALGDVADEAQAVAAVAGVPLLRNRAAPLYLKLAFVRRSTAALERALEAAAETARSRADGSAIVACVYADHEAAGGLAPALVTSVAADLGVSGVLVDTFAKDGRDLLHWLPLPTLAAWAAAAQARGLLAAVAGSLRGRRIEVAASCGADVLGVRGAACVGGRQGRLSRQRVAAVKAALTSAARPLRP